MYMYILAIPTGGPSSSSHFEACDFHGLIGPNVMDSWTLNEPI